MKTKYFDCSDIFDICPSMKNINFKNMTLWTTDGKLYAIKYIIRLSDIYGPYTSKIQALWRYRIIVNDLPDPIDLFGFRLGMMLYDSIKKNCGSLGRDANDDSKLYIYTFKLYYDGIDPRKEKEMDDNIKKDKRSDFGSKRIYTKRKSKEKQNDSTSE